MPKKKTDYTAPSKEEKVISAAAETAEEVKVEEAPVEPVVEAPKPEPKKSVSGKVVGCVSLNIRSAASVDSEVKTVVGVNTPLTVFEQKGDFYKVSVNGVNGYAMARFVQKDK